MAGFAPPPLEMEAAVAVQKSPSITEAAPRGSAGGGAVALWRRLLFSEYFVLYLSVAYFLLLWPFIPEIASWRNLGNILSNMWPLLVIAIGQMLVLIIGGIDLSQTSIMAFASVVGAVIMTSSVDPVLFEKSPLWGWALSPAGGPLGASALAAPLGILAMLACGALIGALNGVSVAKFSMPPFMVTLVSMIFFSALAIWLPMSENIMHLPAAFVAVGGGGLGAIPYAMLIALGVAALAHLMLSRTVLGRWLYATGTNAKTALVSGVPTARVIVLAYVFSGLCAAVGSVLYSARLEQGRPTLGSNLLMDVVGATVIGGTSLFGGKGKVAWTVFGVLFFVLLSNSLNLLSLSFFTVTIVKGAIILLAALLDVTRTRLMARQ